MLEDQSCLVSKDCQRESNLVACMNGKEPLVNYQERELVKCKLPNKSDAFNKLEVALSLGNSSASPNEQAGNKRHAGDNSDSSSLIHAIGRDNSISCLIHCSRSDYGSVASLNRSFRSLIRSGELYKLRRENGVVEHWVYFSCQLVEWEAFDPSRGRWMHLPAMTPDECFVLADKESLAVGTELLVFGKEIFSHVIYRYSLLTNTWSSGMQMNVPRCLFGSASKGEIGILAGGCDSQGNILSSAELYNSEAGTWKTLPSMNKPRKMCSGMSPVQANAATSDAPPLVAVVDNELYAADYADMEVRKYDKQNKAWVTIGRLPERAASMYGWGLAFRACGNRLIVIGGPKGGAEYIEVNSWVPSEGPIQWDLLGRKRSGSFVYNCAVMGC
uniref:F-box/kelch-repeat protein SKIP11-like n=1 Tax=Nicotiana sylvestris TaxID=4096 RepID=A0A1U7VY32_NICSY|nr:PREDICTED: F-box/kelch-repeat protein SKIP11-like [Nicotiana sylvestris]